MLRFLSIIFALFVSCQILCQDFDHKTFVQDFTSKKYLGRGYVKDGAIKASKLLEKNFKEIGLKAIANEYRWGFQHRVNTFPKTPKFYCDSTWQAGRDFIVHPFSGSASKTGDKVLIVDTAQYKELLKERKLNNFLLDKTNKGNAVVLPEEKLTWSVGNNQFSAPIIQALHPPKKCEAKIEVQAELKNIQSYNVIGKVNGTGKTDSTFYITAHYDHLGAMGKVFFPGANDNAAGVAMLLSIANKIAKNPLKYDVIFIAFAGEEAGLLGSNFYVQNPLTELSKIKMLINLDLVATGSDGATVVNATEFTNDFKKLTGINNSKAYINKITARGSAANSDHYWFYEKGVPSFFIYTQGGPKAYHDIYDVADNLPYTAFEPLQKLILEFLNAL